LGREEAPGEDARLGGVRAHGGGAVLFCGERFMNMSIGGAAPGSLAPALPSMKPMDAEMALRLLSVESGDDTDASGLPASPLLGLLTLVLFCISGRRADPSPKFHQIACGLATTAPQKLRLPSPAQMSPA